MNTPYDDIIHLPHHVSQNHPQMPLRDRAAQFAPFTALTGYDDSIAETGRLTTERRELSEQEQNELNKRFDFLISRLKGSSEVDIVHFVPDVRKPGGEYQTTTGSIKNISLPERIITLDTGVIIHLDDISYIGGSIFSEMMEDS